MTTAGGILSAASGLGSATAAAHLIAVLNGRLMLPKKAGDILVASSTLSAGTAADHLLHLQQTPTFRRRPAVIAAVKVGRMMGM